MWVFLLTKGHSMFLLRLLGVDGVTFAPLRCPAGAAIHFTSKHFTSKHFRWSKRCAENRRRNGSSLTLRDSCAHGTSCDDTAGISRAARGINKQKKYIAFEAAICGCGAAQGDPISFVTDLNIDRRDLTINQRAIVGAKLANLRPGRFQKASAGLLSDETKPDKNKPISRKEAATKVKVSRSSIGNAKVILAANNPELLAAVMADQIGLEKAAEIAGLKTKALQNEALAKAIRKRAARGSKVRRKHQRTGLSFDVSKTRRWQQGKRRRKK
jgi:hypothetical protein